MRLANLAVGIVQLVITVVLAVLALYIGLAMYSKMAHTIDAERELSKGNIAVALEMAGVIIAVAVIVQSGVLGITSALV